MLLMSTSHITNSFASGEIAEQRTISGVTAKNQGIPKDGQKQRDFIKLFEIKICGVNVRGTHALPDDGGVDRRHCKPHNGGQRLDALR